ncbi:GlxA family transcriptional regulator [Microbulbifer sp. ANSA003]|uniref:GlxA family transcriptional regulator n=1 Tax=Microbulbifer sp. ANSA003 TaxID=3243360 RepID=UPI0040425083
MKCSTPSPYLGLKERNKRTVSIVICSGAQCLDIAGPAEVFSFANKQMADFGYGENQLYNIEFLAASKEPKEISTGLKVYPDKSFEEAGSIHTLLVGGGTAKSCLDLTDDSQFLEWLKVKAKEVERIGVSGSGTLVLAKAGVLSGHRATTHEKYIGDLKKYKDIEVDNKAIFVRDKKIYSSVGRSAGIDLALAMVEEDFGRKLALLVAREMILYLKRDGDQSQYSSYLQAQLKNNRFSPLLEWINLNLEQSLSVDFLAKKQAMSPRNFSRCFTSEIGVTPARYLEQVRVEKACQLILEAGISQDVVATQCGFSSQEQMRRAFLRQKGILPSKYRKQFA